MNHIVRYTSLLILVASFAPLFQVSAINYQPVVIKNQNTTIDSRVRINILKGILYSSSMPFSYNRLSVILDGFQREPRGRMRDARISLSPYIVRDPEFIKLFVHELAHYIDIYAFYPTRLRADISNTFYYISWESPTVKRSKQGTMDFVSGYAASNQYEDFAESFVLYVFHNATFADRALRSEAMRQKYLFFSNHVFSWGYFHGTDFSIGIVPSYIWDTTKITYSLQKYLYSL